METSEARLSDHGTLYTLFVSFRAVSLFHTTQSFSRELLRAHDSRGEFQNGHPSETGTAAECRYVASLLSSEMNTNGIRAC